MSHFTRKPISTQQYAKIVKKWLREIGVEDVSQYSTHSMRKTKATVIYNKTRNIDAVRRLLGQSSVTATSAYIGTSDNSALELARNINI
jgi:integrase